MNFLKKILRRNTSDLVPTPKAGLRERVFDSYSLNMRVYKASGGTIIETTTYDIDKDRSRNGLYIITDDKDLGNEISKIITIETLKK